MTEHSSRRPTAKGSTVLSTLDYVRSHLGTEPADRVLAALSADAREALRTVAATDEIPYG